jgi:hypothetical protein
MFLDFVLCLMFLKNTMVWKLELFLSSGKIMGPVIEVSSF